MFGRQGLSILEVTLRIPVSSYWQQQRAMKAFSRCCNVSIDKRKHGAQVSRSQDGLTPSTF